MDYEEIYSLFYTKQTDPTFFNNYTQEEAYEMMGLWLHSIVAMPHVRKCFSSISLDDDVMELAYELVNPEDENSDAYFVKDIFAQGLVICWMQQKIDKNTSLATVVTGKEEHTILNNYKNNMARLKELKLQLKKTIRDRGYYNTENT